MCVCVCINDRPQMQKNPLVSSLPSLSAFFNSCSPGGRLDLVQPSTTTQLQGRKEGLGFSYE
jgi:hypothetical protein